MDEIKTKLEQLIEIKGTMDKEVLKLSEELDKYIVSYYYNDSNIKIRQAI